MRLRKLTLIKTLKQKNHNSRIMSTHVPAYLNFLKFTFKEVVDKSISRGFESVSSHRTEKFPHRGFQS
jgi:hypothetical protein